MNKLVMLLVLLGLTACKKNDIGTRTHYVKDNHSFAQPKLAVAKHLDLNIKVDFDSKTISGKACWTIENTSQGTEIIFDENALIITKVTIGESEQETTFSLGKEVKFHGKALHIKIEPTTTKVNIYYHTTQNAIALQWLVPEQTADKKHPFLFSQGESIWTRTWIPCQDSPGIRYTYTATVTVPKDLLALMSAKNPQQKNNTGVYSFKQDKPIPSYLMALAVGDIQFQSIDNRTGVYAEPSVIKKAAWEFGKLGEMVSTAEKLFGPYRWGRYDVIVLPPSFPYGGMENPNLTFLTPGVLAGDRSLTSLLAHELGHSWSGNLVTNATWDDIWLNEGFTTYVEHRIGEAVFGSKEAKMQDVLSRKVIYDNLEELGITSPDTRLKVSTINRNPDDGLSEIPYEKGYAFLQSIEAAVGREQFDAFLMAYFNAHAFQSITTEDFIRYLKEHLIKDNKTVAGKINLEEWIYKPGVPSSILTTHSADFEAIDQIQKTWRQKGPKGLHLKIQSTNERQHFIDYLPNDLTLPEIEALDQEFHFTDKGNFVIKRQWFVIALKHHYSKAYPAIEHFMLSTSRTGSLLTLYKTMSNTPGGKLWAQQIFEKAKTGYHSTTVEAVQKVLN